VFSLLSFCNLQFIFQYIFRHSDISVLNIVIIVIIITIFVIIIIIIVVIIYTAYKSVDQNQHRYLSQWFLTLQTLGWKYFFTQLI